MAWERIRRRVLDRDGWRCRECRRPGRLEVDHIKPLHRGGTDEMDNLRALCRGCHIDRHRRRLRSPARRRWAAVVSDLMEATT